MNAGVPALVGTACLVTACNTLAQLILAQLVRQVPVWFSAWYSVHPLQLWLCISLRAHKGLSL